ncbi:MAG: AAA family ATPase [Hyphomicrobium aestuarii]|nr:AAA family ATPase [Hyphomicrobium aestuarii]
MKTLIIASQKGGGAKTTTATEMAMAAKSAGLAAAIIDTDPRATSCFWAEARGCGDISISPVFPALIPSRLKALQEVGLVELQRPRADTASLSRT